LADANWGGQDFGFKEWISFCSSAWYFSHPGGASVKSEIIRRDTSILRWDSHLQIEVSRRMISDFTDASPGSEKYQAELQKLIHALNPQSWPPQLAASQNP